MSPDGARPYGSKQKKDVNPWVDNIESLVVAVVLALIIRVFVLEAFVIPTGSMAGSLYGNHIDVTCENCGFHYAFGTDGSGLVLERVLCPNCGWTPRRTAGVSGGDRILVNKVIYRFDAPSRWDPFVFVNPRASRDDYPPKTTYIKRLIGLPGDRLEILRGDVVVNGQVQRKPRAAQETLWMPVYNSAYPWKEHPPEGGKPWAFEDKAWRLDGTRLVVDAPKGDLVWARYGGRINSDSGVIRDTYAYDYDLAVPSRQATNGAGFNVVTDLRVSCDVTAASGGSLVLALDRDDSDERVTVDVDRGVVEVARYSPLGNTTKQESLGSASLTLKDGKTHRIVFSRVDYLLTLTVDGKAVVTRDLWRQDEYETLRTLGIEDRLSGHTKSGVRLGAQDGAFELKNVRIDRDVFYTPTGQRSPEANYYFERLLDSNEYWAMGDNSPESSDSRYWGVVPADHLIGKALLIWWHPLRVGLIH